MSSGPDGDLDPRDPLALEALLSEDERAGRDRVRDFLNERVRPDIATLFAEGRWARELVPELGRLGVPGDPMSSAHRRYDDAAEGDTRGRKSAVREAAETVPGRGRCEEGLCFFRRRGGGVRVWVHGGGGPPGR